jgi:hypothetical protein
MSEECPAVGLIPRIEKLEDRVGGLEGKVGHLGTSIAVLREDITLHLAQLLTPMEKRIMGKLDQVLTGKGNSK